MKHVSGKWTSPYEALGLKAMSHARHGGAASVRASSVHAADSTALTAPVFIITHQLVVEGTCRTCKSKRSEVLPTRDCGARVRVEWLLGQVTGFARQSYTLHT